MAIKRKRILCGISWDTGHGKNVVNSVVIARSIPDLVKASEISMYPLPMIPNLSRCSQQYYNNIVLAFSLTTFFHPANPKFQVYPLLPITAAQLVFPNNHAASFLISLPPLLPDDLYNLAIGIFANEGEKACSCLKMLSLLKEIGYPHHLRGLCSLFSQPTS